jgi:3',5'-nucleoside bisphosphate phosphatase
MPTRRFCLCLILALALVALPASAQYTRNPLPVPDVGDYQTLKCDFHMHTVFSDGSVWPNVRVVEAYQQGLDAIAITDHDDYHPHKEQVSEDLTIPYELAKPLADQLGIILIPGIEITKGEWHFNALFMKDRNVTKGLEKKAALLEAKKQGAFVFWNHPGWKQPERWFPEIAPLWDSQLFKGVELVNGKSFYEGIYADLLEKKLAIMATTDWHMPATEDMIDGRPINLLFVKTRSPEGIKEALESRRSAAWMGGQVWGPEEMLAGLWQGAVEIENSSVRVAPGGAVALRLMNSSAFDFKANIAEKPDWLTARVSSVGAEAGSTWTLRVSKDSPEGEQEANLRIEIANFHTAPDANLVVTIPIRVLIAGS